MKHVKQEGSRYHCNLHEEILVHEDGIDPACANHKRMILVHKSLSSPEHKHTSPKLPCCSNVLHLFSKRLSCE